MSRIRLTDLERRVMRNIENGRSPYDGRTVNRWSWRGVRQALANLRRKGFLE